MIGRAGLLLVCLGLLAGESLGQAPAQAAAEMLRVDRMNVARLPTPVFQTRSSIPSTGRGGGRDEWIEFSVLYRTAPDWIDELTFTYYVVLDQKDTPQTPYKLLTTAVTYVNVEKGRSHRATAYLHPTTFARYGRPARWAVVITTTLGGRPFEVIKCSEGEEQRQWWRQLQAEEGLLLNRNETPFAFFNLSDLEAIKSPAATRR